MKAFFDYINAQGGIYGRKITFLIGDDHYNPADTVEVVRKLVEQDKVFGIISGLGEETHSAVWKYLEERGIPDMSLSTGLDKWTNPVAKNRFAGNPDYITEGRFLGQYIAEDLPQRQARHPRAERPAGPGRRQRRAPGHRGQRRPDRRR